MKRCLLLCVLCTLFSVSGAHAQVPELLNNEAFRDDAQAAVDSLYNFNAKGANKRLASWKQKYPKHPFWQLMNGMEFWWILLSDLDDTSRDDYFYTLMEKVDYAAAKLLYEQPGHTDALLIRTVANGYVARQHSNREEWTASLNAARKAYTSLGYMQDASTKLPDLALAQGLKKYYAAYLPEAYPVVKGISWFLPEGDKQGGITLLKQAAQNAVFARAEAAYFLGNIYFNYENDRQAALKRFQALYRQYPNNNYYARLLVKNLYRLNRFEEAERVIENCLQRWQEQSLPFQQVLQEELWYWKAQLLRRKGNTEEAAKAFQQSFEQSEQLPNAKARDYYIASAFNAGRMLQQLNNTDKARFYFRTVVQAETDNGYKEAAREGLAILEK